jgi:xanthine/uracil/vitamin C permease (AzgA family)
MLVVIRDIPFLVVVPVSTSTVAVEIRGGDTVGGNIEIRNQNGFSHVVNRCDDTVGVSKVVYFVVVVIAGRVGIGDMVTVVVEVASGVAIGVATGVQITVEARIRVRRQHVFSFMVNRCPVRVGDLV